MLDLSESASLVERGHARSGAAAMASCWAQPLGFYYEPWGEAKPGADRGCLDEQITPDAILWQQKNDGVAWQR